MYLRDEVDAIWRQSHFTISSSLHSIGDRSPRAADRYWRRHSHLSNADVCSTVIVSANRQPSAIYLREYRVHQLRWNGRPGRARSIGKNGRGASGRIESFKHGETKSRWFLFLLQVARNSPRVFANRPIRIASLTDPVDGNYRRLASRESTGRETPDRFTESPLARLDSRHDTVGNELPRTEAVYESKY